MHKTELGESKSWRVRVVVERERGRKIQACKNTHQIVKRIWFKKLRFLQVEDAMHRC
jgi:hypothetical protein